MKGEEVSDKVCEFRKDIFHGMLYAVQRSPRAKEMPRMTTIGIIGSGHVGSNLARAASR